MSRDDVWIVCANKHGLKIRLGTVRGSTQQAARENARRKFGDEVLGILKQ